MEVCNSSWHPGLSLYPCLMESCLQSADGPKLTVTDQAEGVVLITFVLTSLFNCFYGETGYAANLELQCGDSTDGADSIDLYFNVTGVSAGDFHTEEIPIFENDTGPKSFVFNIAPNDTYRFCLQVIEPRCLDGIGYHPLALKPVCVDHSPNMESPNTTSWSGQLAQMAHSLNPFQASNNNSSTSESSNMFSYLNPFQASNTSFSASSSPPGGSWTNVFYYLNPFRTIDNSARLQHELHLLRKKLERLEWMMEVTSSHCGYQKEHSLANSLIVYSSLLVDVGLGSLREGVWRSGVSGLYSINYSMYNSLDPGEWNHIFLYRNGLKMVESEHESGHSRDGRGYVYDMGGRTMVLKLSQGDTLELQSLTHTGRSFDITFCVTLLRADVSSTS